MPAAEQIARILNHPPTTRISFQLGGLPITPRGFADVARLLLAGSIHVFRDSGIPEDAVAEYNITTNNLCLRDVSARTFTEIWSRAAIVHECVHAMIDKNHATQTTLLTGEAAGYIAQLLYQLHCGYPVQDWLDANRLTPGGAIFAEAYRLIRQFNLRQWHAVLPPNDYEPLRLIINQHPRYRSVGARQLHGADGIE